MKIRDVCIVLALATSACASTRVDTASMPQGVFPAGDEDQSALREALLTVGASGRLPATPQGRAKSYADVEFVSGVFNTSSRWDDLDGLGQAQIMIGRREVRDYLGISQQAPSQAVVDALMAVSTAPNDAALTLALGNPVFTLGAQQTLVKLQDTPHLTNLPFALAHLSQDIRRARDGTEAGGNARM